MASFRAHQRSRRLVFLASIQLNHPCIKAESYSWSASGSVYGTVVKGRRPGARPSGMSPEVQMLLLVDVCSSESLPLLRHEYHFKRVYAQATRDQATEQLNEDDAVTRRNKQQAPELCCARALTEVQDCNQHGKLRWIDK